MNIFDITVKDAKGNDVSLNQYKGKTLLIVNTATECGFTPQYALLQEMYEKLKDKGLEILDFPCDQFGHQAPGTNEEIAKFCSSRFGVTFPQFAKIDVNGENETELFKTLKAAKGFGGFDKNHQLTEILEKMLSEADPDYAKKSDIKWNFTKFLVNKSGAVVARFEPTHDMADVEKQIEAIL